MKSVKFLFVAVLASMIVLFTPFALALPNGSYLKSCKRCHISHHQLICHCLTRDQFWVRSQLAHPRACDNIRNRDGQLICKYDFVYSLPKGSYQKSCSHCKYNGHRLACDCRKRNQHLRYSELRGANHCFRIQNFNGRLTCIG